MPIAFGGFDRKKFTEKRANATFIGQIYEAAIRPGLRPALLENISAQIGADLGGTVLVMSTSGHQKKLPTDEDGLGELAISLSLANAHSETIAHAELLIEELSPDEAHVHINKTSRAWCANTYLKIPNCNGVIFTWKRSLDLGPFDPATQEFLGVIGPHLGQACLIARRTILDQARSAMRTMELAGLPAAVLASPQRLIRANGHFRNLMPNQVQDFNGSLVFSDRQVKSHLERALACVRIYPSSPNLSLIPIRPAGKHPAAVAHIVPWNRVSADPLSDSFYVLFISHVSRSEPLPSHVLPVLFGLSPAEARVAAAVAKGKTQDEIAVQAGLSVNTIKTQLKAVFMKTGVSRQADLVALMTGTPAFRSV